MRIGRLLVLLGAIAAMFVSTSCVVVYPPSPTPVPMSAKACKYVADGLKNLEELAQVTGATKTADAAKLVADARKNVEGALADYATDSGWTPASIAQACQRCTNLDPNSVPLIDPKTGLPFDPPDPWAASECAEPVSYECISPCCPFWAMENTVNSVNTKFLGESAAAAVAATSADFLSVGASLIPGAETCNLSTP